MSAPTLTLAEASALASQLGDGDPRVQAIAEAFAVVTSIMARLTGARGLPS